MVKSIADSSLKIREVIYVISAVCWFLFQYFSLTQKIESIASAQLAYKQLTDYRVMQLEQVTKSSSPEPSLGRSPYQAVLPKPTSLEDEKQD